MANTTPQEALTARQQAAKGLMQAAKRPDDTRLYSKLEYRAKKKFPTHPTPASLQWLESEYRRKGGTYS